MSKHKITVKKRSVKLGAINRPNRVIQAIRRTSTTKNKITIALPKRSVPPKIVEQRKIQQVVKTVKNGKNRIIRLNKKIVKDDNYRKLQELKDCGKERILVMIACGPSVLENDFSVLNNVDKIDIMVINKPLQQVWQPKYWAFCDQSQYRRNESEFHRYGGLLINSSAVLARKPNQVTIKAKATTGVSRNIHEGYVIGRSSVYANMQTAMWMGYDKVFIFGVDMCAVGGKLHHYGVNPDVPEDKRKERFEGEAKNYGIMASKLPDEIRNRFYFCSSYNPWGFTQKFNKWDHKGALERILELAKSI